MSSIKTYIKIVYFNIANHKIMHLNKRKFSNRTLNITNSDFKVLKIMYLIFLILNVTYLII